MKVIGKKFVIEVTNLSNREELIELTILNKSNRDEEKTTTMFK